MEWIINNWYIVVGIVAVIAFIVFAVIKFAGLPTKEQIKKIKEWLKYAVAEAEKELGGGTGSLKLRAVYDWFIGKFPLVAKFISFDTFAKWVDEALDWLNEQLAENTAVELAITGTTTEVSAEEDIK